jgi:hypothetical protein
MTTPGYIVCVGCRSVYSPGEWLALSILDTLTSRELQRYLIAWEDTRTIEVRACEKCGRSMARAAPTASASTRA